MSLAKNLRGRVGVKEIFFGGRGQNFRWGRVAFNKNFK
jgi:hypothetical protein